MLTSVLTNVVATAAAFDGTVTVAAAGSFGLLATAGCSAGFVDGPGATGSSGFEDSTAGFDESTAGFGDSTAGFRGPIGPPPLPIPPRIPPPRGPKLLGP